MAISITQQIARTGNTLIFGELNGNLERGAPSLEAAIRGKTNWGVVADEIYGEDDCQRLVVENLDDVYRIFQPLYYFSVATSESEGSTTMIVEHSLDYEEHAQPIPLTRESLCMRLLDTKGKLPLNQLVNEQRKALRRAADRYVATVTDHDPKRFREQESIKSKFVSCLIEPAMTYLLLAEYCHSYQTISTEDVTPVADDGKSGQVFVILQPDLENFTLKTRSLELERKKRLTIDVDDEEELVKARSALQTDLKVGRRLVAGAVHALLASVDPESLGADKRAFAKALVESGIADDVMLDHLSPAEAPEVNAKITRLRNEILTESKRPSLRRLPVTKDSAKTLSTRLQREKLNKHISDVKCVTLAQYDDEQQQNQLTTYLNALTPAGKIENEIAALRKRRRGLRELRGEKGLELYLELCLEEAAERSALVKRFRPALRRILMNEVPWVEPSDEEDFREFHDRLLMVAGATLEDYMLKVAPRASNLLGIEEFLCTVGEAKHSRPRVLVANTNLNDIIADFDSRRDFESLLSALNSQDEKTFENAISLAIVPRLPAYAKDEIFELGYRHGFATFVSPDTPTSFNTLNNREEVDSLCDDWTSPRTSFQSGVLCLPDHVMIPAERKFLLGRFYQTDEMCHFELSRPVTLPACFSAAALVARNDDPKVVKETLRGKGIRIEDRWPCLGMRFGEKDHEDLWVSSRVSEGVIDARMFDEPLPMAVFEHARGQDGELKKQRLRYLNTLQLLQGKTVSLSEFRVVKYLERLLRLNYPEGVPTNALVSFADDLGGVTRDKCANSLLDRERYKIVYDQDSQNFRIEDRAREVRVTGFQFSRAEDEENFGVLDPHRDEEPGFNRFRGAGPTEDISFTTYTPRTANAYAWTTMLAYAHLPEVFAEVQEDARSVLHVNRPYTRNESRSTRIVRRATAITVAPSAPGVEFNPPRASFLWLEDWHRVAFRMRVTSEEVVAPLGLRGRVSFLVGPVVVGDVEFRTQIADRDQPSAASDLECAASAAYRAIFVSYAHADAKIVDALEIAYGALGDQYLRDSQVLRAGERWSDALMRMIDDADVFQLCWSDAAKNSSYVEQEWQHALKQKRPAPFIRPMYWEDPMPEPPPELADIQFAYYPVA